MNFNFDISVSALTVFIQGILSFFSPCVLPILPLYISYFAGGTSTKLDDGTIIYNQKKVFLHTLFFVLGISITFFVLGFSFTAFGQFFSKNQDIIAIISGLLMILFGIYQLGVIKKTVFLEKEHRLNLKFDMKNLNLFSTFILGFTFSFAWTPCVGPILASVLLMAGTSTDNTRAFLLILCYTIGFIIPFLCLGIFTSAVLNFLKRKQNIVKYSIKLGGCLLIVMGAMTLNSVDIQAETLDNNELKNDEIAEVEENSLSYTFNLTDQYGKTHNLDDYQGKVIFINFWATWCPPCIAELPYIQKIYENFGYNEGEVIILGVTTPGVFNESGEEYISNYLQENGYEFPVMMDFTGKILSDFDVTAFPTTFMIDKNGDVFGNVTGGLTIDMMTTMIEQTLYAEE
ncbi:MAG: cytochrome c biogenesis protein/redoxin [Clostridia bacterium]